jgi:SAM-dependent methyltransferase
VGIDPVAPDGAVYRQVEFERAGLPERVDGLIACTSLHHVSDPEVVLDKVAATLKPTGLLIVVEWDWEGFDEATARWCFERLGSNETHGWLVHHRDEWATSGKSWDEYLRGWAAGHGIHSVRQLLPELDRRFEQLVCERGAYCFEDLPDVSEAEELQAINAGLIKATRIDYVGRAG